MLVSVRAYGIIYHMSDDEIKHEQDTPVDVSTDGSDATSETAPPLPPDFPTTAVNLPIVEPKSTSRKGLIILLVLLGLLSLGGGSAFAYYIVTTNKPKPVVANVATPSPTVTPKPLVADAVLYQTSVAGKNVGTCSTSTATLYRQSVGGGKATKVLDIPDYQDLAWQDTYKDQVAVITSAACASKTGPQIWFSTDSGNSFSKLFEAPSKDDVITSMKFASDGKTVAFGYLGNGLLKAVVKEIDTSSKETKDLFTSTEAGVYIKGYDHKNGKIYFNQGCYGCDSSTEKPLSVYDITNKSTSPVFTDTASLSYGTVLNSDFTKGVRIRATSVGAVGTKSYDKADYVIDEFDTKTGTLSAVTTSELKDSQQLGISAGFTQDGMVYYTKENDIYVVDKDNKSTVLLTSENPIITVYSIGNSIVIYKNIYVDDGNKDSKADVYTDRVVLYDINTEKSVPVVTFKDHQSIILGIAWR
ncbi:MAG: hypothetical protein QG549_691 [Patescibacteria group bacterium]|jgi:hypothetical protein|nr:hypothetical protein [Patescibacteria group bacterium]